ncbi:MAG: PIN domain-containing protein [Methanosarcinales archaeon]
MNIVRELGAKGQIVIPKDVREHFGLRKGSKVVFEVKSDEIRACMSYLTWDEIVYVISKISGRDNGKRAGSDFFLFPNLRIPGVDEEIVKYAQNLIEKYNLKPRDAIRAASAIKNGAKEIITNDNDFDIVNELERVGLEDV